MDEIKKNKLSTIFKIVSISLIFVGLIILTVGIAGFLKLNAGLIHNDALLIAMFTIFLVIAFGGVATELFFLIKARNSEHGKTKLKIWRIAFCVSIAIFTVAFAMFLTIMLNGVVIDIFQPLVLSTVTMIILILSVVLIIIGLVLALLYSVLSMGLLRGTGLVGLMLVCIMSTGLIWANTQSFGDFTSIVGKPQFIFQNGESGYSTFRIPSLIALDKEVLNTKHNLNLSHDVLVATAEGRQNGSRDIGKIDLVIKTSIDGGDTWSDLGILAEWTSDDGKLGKIGNPTAVFDTETGKLVFVYMQTPLDKVHYLTYSIQGTVKADGQFEWTPPHLLNDNTDYTNTNWEGLSETTIMSGPGKGIQLQTGTNKGRILIPCSSGGVSYALISDDHGATWRRGDSAGEGNECEMAELENGEIIMVVRENRGCTDPHPEQYQRVSFSNDGGNTWYNKTLDTTLKSPICMSTLVTDALGITYMVYQDDFFTRARLSYSSTNDNGETWSESKLIYDGAAGYSCVTAGSDGSLYVLAEIGKVEYNEMLVFMKLS